MKAFGFIAALVITALVAGMVYGSMVTPSPIQSVTIAITSLMLVISIIGVRITWKELRENH